MRKILSLALVGLTTLTLPVRAASQFSGSIRTDAEVPFEGSNLQNNIYISRARIDLSGDVSKDVTWKLRLEHPTTFDMNAVPVMKVPVAKVTWAPQKEFSLTAGLDSAGFSQAETESPTYIDRSLGVLEDQVGTRLGLFSSGLINDNFGYSVGVWRATARGNIENSSFSVLPISNDLSSEPVADVNISVTQGQSPTVTLSVPYSRYALGGRVNYVLQNLKDFKWGVGGGFQTLDQVIPVVVLNGNDYSTFNKRVAFALDSSMNYKKLLFNTSLFYFNYGRDKDASSAVVSAAVNAFQEKNTALSGYVELAGLVIGDGYDIDKKAGVVNKIKFDPERGALELAVRVGREQYNNFAGVQFVQNKIQQLVPTATPYTFAKKTGYNLVTLANALVDDDFAMGYSGYTINVAYYMNSNITWRASFNDTATSYRSNNQWTKIEREVGIRLRGEFKF